MLHFISRLGRMYYVITNWGIEDHMEQSRLRNVESRMRSELLAMLERDPAMFQPEVTIQTSHTGDVAEIEEKLSEAGVAYAVRRLGVAATELVHDGLKYSGPKAVEIFLADRV